MSQRVVEATLGRLLTDSEFRRGFYADPGSTVRRESLDLTPPELDALIQISPSRVQAFAKELDARIVRAAVGGAYYWGHWASARASRDRPRPRLARGAKG